MRVEKIGKEEIPLLISIGLVIISILMSVIYNYNIDYKHILGSILIFFSGLLFFKNVKMYILLFVLTLTIGMINVIDIFYKSVEITMFGITINPLFLLLLVLFLIFNKERLNKLFPN